MKLIPLSTTGPNKGKYSTQVDDEDYDYLMQWKWFINTSKSSGNLYAIRSKSPRQMHRVLLNLDNSKDFGDHIDHNGLNNQRSNLRKCNRSENNKNTKSSGSSKYLGVCLQKNKIRSFRKKTNDYIDRVYLFWHVNITINGKNKSLGTFKNEIDAAKAYNEAAIIHHKEFANLNKF